MHKRWRAPWVEASAKGIVAGFKMVDFRTQQVDQSGPFRSLPVGTGVDGTASVSFEGPYRIYSLGNPFTKCLQSFYEPQRDTHASHKSS